MVHQTRSDLDHRAPAARREPIAAPRDRQASDASLLHPAKQQLVWWGIGDVAGCCVDANEYLASATGYSRAEFQSGDLWWTKLTPPECRERARRNIVVLRKMGFCPAFETEVICKDGHRLPLLLHVAMAPDDPQRFLVLAIDMTRQKEAERELRLSESRVRLLIEGNKQCACFVLDTQGIVSSWNDVASRLYGYTPEEAVGRHVSMLHTTHEIAAGVPRQILERAAADERAEDEGWRLRKDGSRFWGQAAVVAMRDDDGQLVGFMKMTTDMTRWRRSEALLASTLNSVADGIIGIDVSGRIDSFNAAAERMFGYRETEVAGRSVNILMPEPRHLSSSAAKVIGVERTAAATRKDGTVFPIELAVGQFMLNGEQHYTAVVRDATHQLKLEDQLRQSQKMEAIGQLAGGVAHDFNNLLTIIVGYCELLLDEMPVEDPSRGYVTGIGSAAERATSLTSQLLAFSRRSVRAPKLLDLNSQVLDTEKMLRRIIGEDIELSTVLAPNLARVNADPGQIDQVLMNLVVNARDAMPRGGQLVIETANVELDDYYCAIREGLAPGPYVALTVTDSGTGMSLEVKERLFEPFFTTKDAGKGTGLGLATVYGIVKQNAGHIQVYSEPSLGASFKIVLPADLSSVEVAASTAPAELELQGHETILLVEDEEQVREVTRAVLERFGYQVIEATNGQQAIELFDRTPRVDLVLTDVVMPHLGGRDLARSLRQRKPGLKIVCMSGYTNDTVLRRGIVDAEVAFVQKPFTPRALAKKVRETLDLHQLPLLFTGLTDDPLSVAR